MKKHLLANTKNAYKANLHAHTNISDGKFSPEELKELYKSNGYSVVAYTDHEIFIPHPELTDGEFIALSGVEVQFNGSNRYPGVAGEKKCHICLIAKEPDTVEQPCWKEAVLRLGSGQKLGMKRLQDWSDIGSVSALGNFSCPGRQNLRAVGNIYLLLEKKEARGMR